MATSVGSAYVTLIPSMTGFAGKVGTEFGGAGIKAGKSFGDGLSSGVGDGVGKSSGAISRLGSATAAAVGTGAKAIAASAAAASAAVGGIAASALNAYASYEQLVGGVDTIFGKASGKVQEYAAQVYKTAGMSANEYMTQVTSFSASLIQSLDGDTTAAAEAANRAMTDMSDNANKMGTDMESITNAYQGFAKQNYTMLDNLKLGYGGTQSEMQRLISDAAKMTDTQKELGITVDASSMSFGNIVNAISVVQAEMGIAGTTAAEAADTIEGSVNTMKAAWTNWLTGLGNESADMNGLTSELVQSVETAAKNVVPRVAIILSALGSTIASQMPGLLAEAQSYLASFDWSGMASSLTAAVTGLLASAVGVVSGFDWSTLMTTAQGVVLTVMNGIGAFASQQLPVLFSGLLASLQASGISLNIVTDLVNGLRTNLGLVVDGAMQMALSLAQGIANGLPNIIENVPKIISGIAGCVNDNLPKVAATALQIIATLASGLVQSIPTLIANIPAILAAMFDAFMAFNWLALGKSLVTVIGDGIKGAASSIAGAAKAVVDKMTKGVSSLPAKMLSLGKSAVAKLASSISGAAGTAVKSVANIATRIVNEIKKVPSKFLSVGKNIVQGLWNGISGSVSWIVGKVGGFANDVLNSAKKALGIASPSKEFAKVGNWMMVGWANGIDRGAAKTLAAVKTVSRGVLDAANVGNIGVSMTAGITSAAIAADGMAATGATTPSTTAYRAPSQTGGNSVVVNLNYSADADANQMVRDIAAGLRRLQMTGA